MLIDCIITVGEQTFTTAEFIEYVTQNGLGALSSEGTEPNALKEKILHKYNVEKLEESLSEIWTNLEREKKGLEPLQEIYKKDVEAELNPEGQLSDYGTQKKIRYNTYSGIALTGISANFGKMMGYLFDAENIRSITNGEETVSIDSKRFEELGGDKTKITEFLNNNKSWKIQDRNIPTLKNQYHFNVNGQNISTFERNERELVENQQISNIFETIDTVINLAIDNVKEGKLHILGITNSNANAYLAMVGMGLPLSVVSRIFKTPVMRELNEGGRWIAKNINRNNLDPILEQLAQYSPEEINEALDQIMESGKKAGKLQWRIKKASGRDNLMDIIRDIPINTDMLDEIYTGKATPLVKLLSDAAVLSTMKKLIPVGEQMFNYAQVFSLLRGMPSKKWKLDSIIDKIEGLVEFEGENAKKSSILSEYTNQAKEFFKDNDPEYQRLLSMDEEAADEYLEQEFSKVKDSDILFGTPRAAARASFVNRLIRGSVDTSQVNSASSVFEDNIVTRLPHVMAAYRAAVELRTLMEKAFRMHAPAVRKLAERIVDRANIFSPFDKLEKTDYIQKEIVKYLGSNLRFKLDGQDFSTEIPANTETFATSTTIVSGAEAWAQRLIKDLGTLSSAIQGNEFLDSLEVATNDATGLRSLKMLANKINDEEIVEQIRDDFGKLAISHPQIARDLFKYALLTEGMYYERTGLALVFPDMWAAEFSQALEQRVDSIIPLADPITEYNLALLEDAFIYQFVRNNPDFVGYPREGRAQEQGTVKNAKGYTEKIMRGEDDGVFFDLRYPGTSYETMPKFIKYFSNDIYFRLDVPGRSSTYYVKVVEGANHSFYDFSPYELEKSLDLDKIAANKNPLISAIRITNNVYTGEETNLPVGQLVWAFDKSASLVKEARVYRIEEEGKEITVRNKKYYKYRLSNVSTVDLSKESQATTVRKQVTRFLPERIGNTVVITNIDDYLPIVRNQVNARILTASPIISTNVINLPTGTVPSDISRTEEAELLKDLGAQIQSLDKDITYFVDANILEGLNNRPSLKSKVAEELYKKIAFLHPVLKENTGEVKNNMALNVLLAIKDNEVVSATVSSLDKVVATPEGSSTHIVPKEAVFKKGWKNIVTGSFIKLGEKSYAYVDARGTESLSVTQFPASLMEFIDTPTMSKESFEQLVLEKSPC